MPRLGCSRPGFVPNLTLALLVVALGCREDASSPTAPEPPALATAATTVLAIYQLSTGDAHTCGVTTDNRAYCWGVNGNGRLGDGTTGDRRTPVAVVGGSPSGR